MYEEINIGVIIPTIGRKTLARTLYSLERQLSPKDEVIVVADGPCPEAKSMVHRYNPDYRFYSVGPTNLYGHAQRNFGMRTSRASHLVFIDDDDFYLPGAMAVIRHHIKDQPHRIHVFKMLYGTDVLWREQKIAFGNISTQMFVIPRHIALAGRWRCPAHQKQGGDHQFMQEICKATGENPLWHEDVIAALPFHNRGR